MTLTARRAFVAIDEWLGIAAVLYVHRCDPSLFWPALAMFAVLVYGVSYPWLWWWERRESRE